MPARPIVEQSAAVAAAVIASVVQSIQRQLQRPPSAPLPRQRNARAVPFGSLAGALPPRPRLLLQRGGGGRRHSPGGRRAAARSLVRKLNQRRLQSVVRGPVPPGGLKGAQGLGENDGDEERGGRRIATPSVRAASCRARWCRERGSVP